MHAASGLRRWALGCGVALGGVLAGAGTAAADTPHFTWKNCGQTPEAATTQCANARLPMDYDKPGGRKVVVKVARVPAASKKKRLGALFFNFGGPGGTSVDYLQSRGASTLWHKLNKHFDIIGFDPRGVGQSKPEIDCHADQQTQGIYSQPFPTPLTFDAADLVAKDKGYIAQCQRNNGPILSHVSTANVARDMDQIRKGLGEDKLNYLGFSYGTFLGSTYASMFPHRYRAMVLDGPIDAKAYINKPWRDLAEQTQGFERALGRFFEACAGNQAACSNFGGNDPWDAYDQLVEQANAHPIPATGYTPDPRPVDGDDLNFFAMNDLYAKELWPEIGEALAQAKAGDASLIREIVDGDYGRNDDGSYSNSLDLYFTIGATEQRYPTRKQFYFDRGDEAWGMFDHFWLNNGYVELNYGLWPSHDSDAYDGPFKVPGSAQTPLVVATTYDPATPYRGALRLVHDLGNARLITMRGDGHTAYGGESACIDSAVNTYLRSTTLPAKGTECTQDTPFAAAAAQSLTAKAKAQRNERRVIASRVPGTR